MARRGVQEDAFLQTVHSIEAFSRRIALATGEWPEVDPKELKFDPNVVLEGPVLGTVSIISKKLASAAPLEIQPLDELTSQIMDLDAELRSYDTRLNHMVVDSDTDEDQDELEAKRNEEGDDIADFRVFMTDIDHGGFAHGTPTQPTGDPNALRRPSQVQGEAGALTTTGPPRQKLGLKMVEFAVFPGFNERELTPLPGILEPPYILARVTEAMRLSRPLKKEWRKWFLSEAAAAMLQDAFWWIFLHRFQRDIESQDKLFTRIADSYVALFTRITPRFKEEFFKRYPDALSQAIYSTFCEAFPKSAKRFNDEFKTSVCNLVYEWITGTKAPPFVWERWQLGVLEPNAMLREARADEEVIPVKQPTKGKELLEFGDAAGSSRPDGDGDGDKAIVSVMVKKRKETTRGQESSIPSGPSAGMTRVLFDVNGNSPLVAHYMRTHKFPKDAGLSILVNRSEPLDSDGPQGPTYKEIVASSTRTAKEMSDQYANIRRVGEKERNRIWKEMLGGKRKMEVEQARLLSNPEQVKQFSDKLVGIMSAATGDAAAIDEIQAKDTDSTQVVVAAPPKSSETARRKTGASGRK